MVDINLLPWREYRNEIRKKKFLTLIGASLLLPFIMLYSVHSIFDKKILALKNELIKLEEKIPSSDKDNNSPEIARDQHTMGQKLMLDFLLTHEEEVCFTKVHYRLNSLVLSGYAPSVWNVNEFLKNNDNLHLFSQMSLEKMKQINPMLVQFQVSASRENENV